jgi:hypothetical protein
VISYAFLTTAGIAAVEQLTRGDFFWLTDWSVSLIGQL